MKTCGWTVRVVVDQGDRARGVADEMAGGQLDPADPDRVPVLDRHIGRDGDALRVVPSGIGAGAGRLDDLGQRLPVVAVAVGGDDGRDGVVADQMEQGLGLVGRVDQQLLAGGPAAQQIGCCCPSGRPRPWRSSGPSTRAHQPGRRPSPLRCTSWTQPIAGAASAAGRRRCPGPPRRGVRRASRAARAAGPVTVTGAPSVPPVCHSPASLARAPVRPVARHDPRRRDVRAAGEALGEEGDLPVGELLGQILQLVADAQVDMVQLDLDERRKGTRAAASVMPLRSSTVRLQSAGTAPAAWKRAAVSRTSASWAASGRGASRSMSASRASPLTYIGRPCENIYERVGVTGRGGPAHGRGSSPAAGTVRRRRASSSAATAVRSRSVASRTEARSRRGSIMGPTIVPATRSGEGVRAAAVNRMRVL